MHINEFSLALADEAATLALGAALAPAMAPGLICWLEGDLGAGKTTLVRGLLRALGDTGPVKSPTYTLVELHVVSGLDLYHFDFYRFNQPEEYLDAGLDEYFSGTGACLVEWPDRAAPYLPSPDLRIHLSVRGDGRLARVEAGSERGRQCLTSCPFPAGTSSGSPPAA
jgi:tRNA threonylcarbamoyladenosine biosynthesis protein TsaE